MIICVAGDIHGAIDRLYADVADFERALGATFGWVLQVGDFGVWPDPLRIDSATRKHGGAGDFPRWFAERRPVPRPTLFIHGNHEDVEWLAARGGPELVPGLWHLKSGGVFRLAPSRLTVGGVGGCYSETDYPRQARSLQRHAKRHYTRDEVEALAGRGAIDLLLFHDAPAGVHFREKVSATEGLDLAIAHTRPRLVLFGHHHTRIDVEVAGVPCLGLNKMGQPGNLVALEVDEQSRDWKVLGEWPKPEAGGNRGAPWAPSNPSSGGPGGEDE